MLDPRSLEACQPALTCSNIPNLLSNYIQGATAAVLVYTHTHTHTDTGTLSSAYESLRADEASQPCFHPLQLVGALVGRWWQWYILNPKPSIDVGGKFTLATSQTC